MLRLAEERRRLVALRETANLPSAFERARLVVRTRRNDMQGGLWGRSGQDVLSSLGDCVPAVSSRVVDDDDVWRFEGEKRSEMLASSRLWKGGQEEG